MYKKKEEKLFECSICFKKIKNKYANYRRHMDLHSSKCDRVKCVLCSKTFQTKGNLQVHRKNVHNIQNFDNQKMVSNQSKGNYILMAGSQAINT